VLAARRVAIALIVLVAAAVHHVDAQVLDLLSRRVGPQ
jgi:hypothetical protein